jgi:hypothetical protein
MLGIALGSCQKILCTSTTTVLGIFTIAKDNFYDEQRKTSKTKATSQ